MSLRRGERAGRELLGRHVVRRAGTCAVTMVFGAIDRVLHLRDAEVDDDDALLAAERLEHHVVGLEVAVEDALVVRGRERVRHLPDDLRGAPEFDPAGLR